MTSGNGDRRARLTATEPITRWVAWDELPTTSATVSPAWASRMAVAAAISSSAMMPYRRTNSQAAPRPLSCSAVEVRSSCSISLKSDSISAMAPGDRMATLDS
jgi:hypothetical protein